MPYARFSQITETIGKARKREARDALLQQSLAFAVGFGVVPLTEALGIYDDVPANQSQITEEEAIRKAEDILKKYAQRREAVANG